MLVLADYVENLEDVETKLTAEEKEYKFTVSYLKEIEEINMTVKITSVNEDMRAVSFTKNKGSTLEFFELYAKMMEDLPDLADGLMTS